MKPFVHRHSAHCETGVVSSMMYHHGLPLSEPMVFGLSNAMVFAYLPFVKLSGMPLIAYRMMPKAIVKGIQKQLGIKMAMETFSSPQKGVARLDELLKVGKICGLQTSVFWLPYFPNEMRFHFNAHNLIVYGKDEDNYLISDPVFEKVVVADSVSLEKARFIKGMMAPKGLIYYPTQVPSNINYHKIIPKVIRKTSNRMLKTPLPNIGIKGIRLLAKSILKLKTKDKCYTRLFLGHIVRMQEEIGTGGAGFRYIYASFLQESAKILDNNDLNSIAEEMTLTGDMWREFALMIAKEIRKKKSESINLDNIADFLNKVADSEKVVYQKLLKVSFN